MKEFQPPTVLSFAKHMPFAIDKALDQAYGYGLSSNPESFGFKANFFTSWFMLELIIRGVTDVEKLAEAAHNGWAHTVITVDDPNANVAKKIHRQTLARTCYQNLSDQEREKDRVAARAVLKFVQAWEVVK